MKKPIILFSLFLALLAFVYFYEIEGEEGRTKARELEESLFRLGEEEVISVLISRPGQPDISLGREGEGWVLSSPLAVDADGNAVEALLRALKTATRVRTLTDGAAKAQEYGLGEPRLRIAVRSTGQARRLLLGAEDYTGSNLYAQFEGETDVFLTEKALLTASDKDLLGWRSRKVLDFDRNRVTAIEVENSGESVKLAKRDGDWFLEAPLQERADSNAVQGLLASLEFAEVQEFVSEEPQELASFGLEPPAASVRLGSATGGVPWTSLQLGNPRGGFYLARDPQRSAVFSVEKKIFEQLSSTAWTFREKDVVNVEQDQVLELRIRRGGEEEIQLRYEEYAWTVLRPESHRDAEALSYKFWYPINDIRFQSIEDEAAAEELFPRPDVSIGVTLKDGTTRSFEFVGRDGRYLARRTDSGRRGRISEQDFNKLKFKIEDIL